MVPLYNGFYPFPLSRAVNSNSLIFDPSEFKIDLYLAQVDFPLCLYFDMFFLLALFLDFDLSTRMHSTDCDNDSRLG